ncbi:MAG: ABC transporter substrate-binding protein [Prevotella sp.]|nr:ABC transporter substrate-binding protein [Prevotella sp.]
MRHFLRYTLLLFLLAGGIEASAQQGKTWKEMHKVKKKETIYGIAKDYGLTEEELRKANPEMLDPNYKLRKGDYIFIPFPTPKPTTATQVTQQPSAIASDLKNRAIRVGIMLPLHDVDGDGRRMVEYYRGILMACNDLKREGISTDIKAWNVNIDADIRQTLLQNGADQCDIIFGPLYTKQMDAISSFVKTYGIKLVIPFSINGNHVADNENIFQVYQSPEELNEAAVFAFMDRFSQHNLVLVDCNDKNSNKGMFTSAIRKSLEDKKINYHVTNLTNSDETFARAFSLDKPNVVVLNTGRSPELNTVLAKLDVLTNNNKGITVSLFGYNDWLLYEKYNLEKFYKYDTFVPTHYYYNTVASRTQELENAYRKWFGTSMMNALPRFALTGYDQATFFLRGMHTVGKGFTGSTPNKYAVQTQYRFERVGKKGGLKNRQFMLVHYNRNRSISSIVY